jgi:hypothetical protein
MQCVLPVRMTKFWKHLQYITLFYRGPVLKEQQFIKHNSNSHIVGDCLVLACKRYRSMFLKPEDLGKCEVE